LFLINALLFLILALLFLNDASFLKDEYFFLLKYVLFINNALFLLLNYFMFLLNSSSLVLSPVKSMIFWHVVVLLVFILLKGSFGKMNCPGSKFNI